MKNKKGFTLIELIAIIAILSVLVLLSVVSVVKVLNNAKVKKMIISENDALEISKLYIEDYCDHPINDNYECAPSFEYNETKKFICLSTLKKTNINESLLDDIKYDEVKCDGLILFTNENDKGKTYLKCVSDSGEIVYDTNEYIDEEDRIDYSNYDECFSGSSEFVLTYHSNNIEDIIEYQTCNRYENCTILEKPSSFNRNGYTFKNWNTASNGIGKSYDANTTVKNDKDLNRNSDLYAIWEPKIYIVKYNSNGGNGSVSDSTCSYGSTCSLRDNEFTKNGYTFIGWSKDSNATVSTYTNSQNVNDLLTTYQETINLYAIWKANEYTIIYDSNGGSGNLSDTICSYGSNCSLRNNTFIRTEFIFNGWNTVSDGSGTSYTDGQNVNNLISENNGNVRLFAQWVPEEKILTVYGAVEETITYTGTSSGSFKTDSTGSKTIELKPGTYSFTGSVSKYTLSNYVVTSSTTNIYVWPQGTRMLYWYGTLGWDDNNQRLTINSTTYNKHSKGSSSSTSLTLSKNNILATGTAYGNSVSYEHSLRKIYFDSKIDITSYSKFYIKNSDITQYYDKDYKETRTSSSASAGVSSTTTATDNYSNYSFKSSKTNYGNIPSTRYENNFSIESYSGEYYLGFSIKVGSSGCARSGTSRALVEYIYLK